MNKTGGFFVECGAFDGETDSSTLYMERTLGWTGLLIEANADAYNEQLLRRNRKSWSLPVCVSLQPYPTTAPFRAAKGQDGLHNLIFDDTSPTRIEHLRHLGLPVQANDTITTVQCFPLYSILLAVNRTQVDYLALDLSGHEYEVIRSIPFAKVNITVSYSVLFSTRVLKVDNYERK